MFFTDMDTFVAIYKLPQLRLKFLDICHQHDKKKHQEIDQTEPNQKKKRISDATSTPKRWSSLITHYKTQNFKPK